MELRKNPKPFKQKYLNGALKKPKTLKQKYLNGALKKKDPKPYKKKKKTEEKKPSGAQPDGLGGCLKVFQGELEMGDGDFDLAS